MLQKEVADARQRQCNQCDIEWKMEIENQIYLVKGNVEGGIWGLDEPPPSTTYTYDLFRDSNSNINLLKAQHD